MKSFAVMHMPQLLMLFKTLPYSIFWVWLKVLANSGAPISCNKPWYIALYNSNWNRHAGTGNNKNSHHCERPKSRSKHEGFRFASGLAVNVYTSQKNSEICSSVHTLVPGCGCGTDPWILTGHKCNRLKPKSTCTSSSGFYLVVHQRCGLPHNLLHSVYIHNLRL